MAENDVDNELLDYEEDEEPQTAADSIVPAGKKEVKGSYVSIHSSGFRDFLLKPELLRAIVDCGFEHPSEGEDSLQICIISFMDEEPLNYLKWLVGVNHLNEYFLYLPQSNMSAFHKPSWVWTSYARQSLEWEKRLYSCSPHYNRLSQLMGRCVFSSRHWTSKLKHCDLPISNTILL